MDKLGWYRRVGNDWQVATSGLLLRNAHVGTLKLEITFKKYLKIYSESGDKKLQRTSSYGSIFRNQKLCFTWNSV